jgi:hypothetical protein
MVLGPVTRSDTHGRLKASCRVHLRAPSHRDCTSRPGLRRSSSRARDPSIRRVYRTPRITVRRRPSSPNASRALECASRQPRPHTLPGVCWTERLARAPSSAAPRAFLPLATSTPGRGTGRWTSKTQLTSNRSPGLSLARQAGDRTPRGARSGRPLTGFRRLSDRPRSDWLSPLAPDLTCPIAGPGRWWAPLLPGGPTLLGFSPLSNELEGSSEPTVLACSPFGRTLRC